MRCELELGPARAAYEAPSRRTPVFVLLGSPIGHSLSPRMQTAAFRAADIDAAYVACEVEPKKLEEVLKVFRRRAAAGAIHGANVTVPLKQAVAARVDRLAPAAGLAGAVNTIVLEREPGSRSVQLAGHNTDVQGLLAALAEQGITLRGAHLLVTGTGGMARAAVVAGLEGGARTVTVCGRDLPRASALLDELTEAWHGELPQLRACPLAMPGRVLEDAHVLVQATSLGMHPGEPAAIDLAAASPGLFVLDAVYGAEPTPLVRDARARGLRACDGRTLLLHQGAAAFTLWTERKAPLDAMRQAIGP